jgi:hypothetical protein
MHEAAAVASVLGGRERHDFNYPVECMRFRLVYDGPLSDRTEKHAVRCVIEPQLEELFRTRHTLRPWAGVIESGVSSQEIPFVHYRDFRFFPLVRANLNMVCHLDVLLLEPEPSVILRKADIDNRLKVLFDALRLPNQQNEIPEEEHPGPDQNPFYVLLEDDALITGVRVETDRLLFPKLGRQRSDVSAIIEVNVKTTRWDVFTAGFNVD